MNDKVYPKPTDLGLGKHLVDVAPMPKFEGEEGSKKPIEGTHNCGEAKHGKWWLYSFKNADGKFTSLFANEENKAWFDTGVVEVNVVHKIDKATKEPIYHVIDGKPFPTLTHFVNQNPATTGESKEIMADDIQPESGENSTKLSPNPNAAVPDDSQDVREQNAQVASENQEAEKEEVELGELPF